MVFVGSWLWGWFIVATNAWMQHAVGYTGSGENAEMSRPHAGYSKGRPPSAELIW